MRVKSKAALKGLRHHERMAKLNEAAPVGVRVVPAKEEYRAVLKHPKAGGFPSEGSKEWPDDRFTKRRLADGSVTVEETQPPPEGESRERRDKSPPRARQQSNNAA